MASAAATEQMFSVLNPATGESAGEAPECSLERLDATFAAAQAAFPEWSSDEAGRREAMVKLGDALMAAKDELTEILIAETGKHTALAETETIGSDIWLKQFADFEIPEEVIRDDSVAHVEVHRHPIGVVAAITAWNFPIVMPIVKLAGALRVGATAVVKPSQFTPLACLRVNEIVSEVLPPGVVNFVTGGNELGAAMTRHPIPRKVTFTGSIAAGKKVAQASGADLKRTTLELGGNDAAILMEDADLAAIIPALLERAWFNVGQTCAVPKRIFVPDKIYDDVVDAFVAAAQTYKLGAGDDGNMGPLSTRPQYERVCELVAETIAGGLDPVIGGKPVDGPGLFFEPTIFADAKEGIRIVDEEQFGPALPLLRYSSIDEAVQRANDTMFGLAASVWGTDLDRATEITSRLDAGVCYVNSHGVHLPEMPMGGSKWSGIGAEHGIEGMLEFTQRRVVYRAGNVTNTAIVD